MTLRFDLQSHSTSSDGALAPAEVVQRAAQAGVELLALSDHDTVDGVADALAVPDSDLRLFGKPESFTKRRMGVALATGRDTDEARERAKLAASKVRPVSTR